MKPGQQHETRNSKKLKLDSKRELMSAPHHHRMEAVTILIRLQTRRSRGIHFPWSESPALHLLNLFLAITGKMIPDPICTQRAHGRSACTHKPSICLEWPTDGTLAQTVTQLWGNTSVQPVTWYLRREMMSKETDAGVWSSLVEMERMLF